LAKKDSVGRRKFLTGAGVAAAGLAMTPQAADLLAYIQSFPAPKPVQEIPLLKD